MIKFHFKFILFEFFFNLLQEFFEKNYEKQNY